MSDRVKTITMDIVEAVRDVMRKHDVTFAEYRAGVGHLIKTQEAKEIPLLLDVFLNSTVVEIENRQRDGSKAAIQGPYFREGAPRVNDSLAIRPEDEDQPRMVMRGRVTDLGGSPVADAVIDVWHSTPEGRYSGVHGNIPIEYYRGKITTDENGRYECRSILPVPYQIPNQGPTGELLEKHMGGHSWRPAHIHYWVHAEGMRDLISQAYFEGDKYIEDDSCNGGGTEFMVPEAYEDGVRVMEVDFRLDPAAVRAEAAE
ncbi:Chlorocatechol 1,2-dioxygenase [Roseivivax jejudonensis]|uniref:Chlorocatechol 1,2-dioxygenase n=1 Tax=Roseivivax jejudonensis TaxID=1529041 RepID=A0A1X7A636_9RHOB|nr:chlorocatechol 1,2-dioxygenase [Roseivivax jejudonensis]SLN71225.1 Chlorocatechol 1,2-dioxygenase [Roseivivax jejudonensis]